MIGFAQEVISMIRVVCKVDIPLWHLANLHGRLAGKWNEQTQRPIHGLVGPGWLFIM